MRNGMLEPYYRLRLTRRGAFVAGFVVCLLLFGVWHVFDVLEAGCRVSVCI